MNNIIANSNNYDLSNIKALDQNLYNDFVQFLDVRETSSTTYRRALKQFFCYIASNNIVCPTRDTILNFKAQLKQEHKATTVQLYMVAVRLFFKWTQQIGRYPNVADNIKGAKISKEHKKDNLTAKQVKKVLKTIDKSTLTGKRDYAIVALMVNAGLRDIEVSRANIEDIRTLGNSTVLYIQGKGRDEKAEYVKIPFELEEIIRDYLQAAGPREVQSPLFYSTSNNSYGQRLSTRTISGIVKGSFINAGFNSDRLTAHSLRHTAATLNLLNGGTLEETQELLRHGNINTTRIYDHHLKRINNNSEERIAKAIF